MRYALLAYGNPELGMWMFYVAILLHGVCFDFFFMTGQLYTDMQAPPNLRSAAQGLIIFLTYGVGMFIGSLLSGGAVDYFTRTVGGVAIRDWQAFWLEFLGGRLGDPADDRPVVPQPRQGSDRRASSVTLCITAYGRRQSWCHNRRGLPIRVGNSNG